MQSSSFRKKDPQLPNQEEKEEEERQKKVADTRREIEEGELHERRHS
jgi:anti-sigma28 factor (negative regulator of flagellin synthesis)